MNTILGYIISVGAVLLLFLALNGNVTTRCYGPSWPFNSYDCKLWVHIPQ